MRLSLGPPAPYRAVPAPSPRDARSITEHLAPARCERPAGRGVFDSRLVESPYYIVTERLSVLTAAAVQILKISQAPRLCCCVQLHDDDLHSIQLLSISILRMQSWQLRPRLTSASTSEPY